MAGFSYTTESVPDNYRCGACGKSGVKLWGGYITYEDLKCAACAMSDQKADVTLDVHGCHVADNGQPVDTIGWLVPAVPQVDDYSTYWGYGSIPDAGYMWWSNLPNS